MYSTSAAFRACWVSSLFRDPHLDQLVRHLWSYIDAFGVAIAGVFPPSLRFKGQCFGHVVGSRPVLSAEARNIMQQPTWLESPQCPSWPAKVRHRRQ